MCSSTSRNSRRRATAARISGHVFCPSERALEIRPNHHFAERLDAVSSVTLRVFQGRSGAVRNAQDVFPWLCERETRRETQLSLGEVLELAAEFGRQIKRGSSRAMYGVTVDGLKVHCVV